MAETHHDSGRTKIATLKVLYLLAVTAVTFIIPAFPETRPVRWLVVPALLAFQALILLACRISVREILRPAWRLKWLFLFLIGCYALLPPESSGSPNWLLDWRIPFVQWSLWVNLTGLEHAGLMVLQILTMLLASDVVRLTGPGSDLVEGLHALRLPRLFVYSFDHTLELFGGVRQPRGRRNRSPQPGFFAVLKRLLWGDVGSFVQSIRGNINLASEHTAEAGGHYLGARLAHDVAIVSGIALAMASLKMLKVLPGVPFASGHKALLLFPLYILAARLTHSRWGATAAGSIMGVIGFLQGDGRFGVLEMLKHLAPGVVIDLAEPLVCRLPGWALGYCLLGLAAAVARTTTEFALVLMLGARAEVYVFPAAKLVPNLLAGFVSGFVTIFVLRAFERARPSGDELLVDRNAQIVREPGDAVEIGISRRRAAAEKPHPPAPTVPANAGDQE